MANALRAGLFYFAAVYSIGFVLGVVRNIAIQPRLGEVLAVLIELPLILVAAWIISDRLVTRFDLADELTSRTLMGFSAFGLLMLAELVVSVWVLGNSAGEYLGHYRTAAGGLGLAGQLLFALFPALQLARGRQR